MEHISTSAYILFWFVGIVGISQGIAMALKSRKDEPTNYLYGKRLMEMRDALLPAICSILIGVAALLVCILKWLM